MDAKLNNQDKSEVDSRKLVFLCKIVNKHLRLRMQKEFKRCESLEQIYQAIKRITAKTNLKDIEYTILNRNKTYNFAIDTVSKKESILQELTQNINLLKEEYANLKTSCNNNI